MKRYEITEGVKGAEPFEAIIEEHSGWGNRRYWLITIRSGRSINWSTADSFDDYASKAGAIKAVKRFANRKKININLEVRN